MQTTALSLSRIQTKRFLRTALYRLEYRPRSLKDYEINAIRQFATSLAASTAKAQCDPTITSPYSGILTAEEASLILIDTGNVA